MTLLGLSIGFVALTLSVVMALVVLLRNRSAAGRRAVPDHAGEMLAISPTRRKES